MFIPNIDRESGNSLYFFVLIFLCSSVCSFQGEACSAQLSELTTKGLKSLSATLYHAKRGKSPFKKGEQNCSFLLCSSVCPFQGEACSAQLSELATKGLKSLSATLYHAKRGKSPFKKGEHNCSFLLCSSFKGSCHVVTEGLGKCLKDRRVKCF